MNLTPIKELTGDISNEKALQRISNKYRLAPLQENFVKVFVEKYGGESKKRARAYMDCGYMAEKKDLYFDFANTSEEAKNIRKIVSVAVYNMMKKPKMQNAVAEYKEIYIKSQKKGIEDDVYRITRLRATYDIRQMADVVTGGSPEEIADKLKRLDEETAFCIDGFDFKYHGKDADKFTVTFKFADRDKAVDRLSKLTGMMVDRKEVKHEGSVMPQINISILGEADTSKYEEKLKDVTGGK